MTVLVDNWPVGQSDAFLADPKGTAPDAGIGACAPSFAANGGLSSQSQYASLEKTSSTASSSLSNHAPVAPVAVPVGEMGTVAMADLSAPFATLILNGVLSVQLNLPLVKSSSAALSFVIPDGLQEPNKTSVHLNSLITIATSIPGSFGARLTVAADPFDEEVESATCKTLPLGALDGRARHRSHFDFLPFVPRYGRLRIVNREHRRAGMPKLQKENPTEARFLASAVDMLHSAGINPGGGSMSTAILLNHCKTLPLYETVVGKIYAHNFHQFVKSHPEEFQLFLLSQQEVEEKGVFPFVKPTESRVAPADMKWEERDAARARAIVHHTTTLSNYLQAVFRERTEPIAHHDLIGALADNEHFLFLSQPSLGLLKNLLLVYKKKFNVLEHPYLCGTVGLKRDRATK